MDAAIQTAEDALKDGCCVIIGLQSTGEARAKDAAKQAGLDESEDGSIYLEDYICDSKEAIKRILLNLFPLPPKPKGVIPPDFLKPKTAEEDDSSPLSSETKAAAKNIEAKAAPKTPEQKAKSKKDRKLDISKLDWRDSNLDDLFSSDEEDDEFGASEPLSSGPMRWDEIPLDSVAISTSVIRRRNYREACHRLKRWFEAVDNLKLPPNPLDRLLNELGGPEKVAGTSLSSRMFLSFYRFANFLFLALQK